MLKLTSSAFKNNEKIPEKYTCKGKNINPPLTIEEIPKNTKSLVLIMDDPDAPSGTWDHWVVFNINPDIKEIGENTIHGKQGRNSWRRNEYSGPCPPSGTHRYFFKLYALNSELYLREGVSKKEIEETMRKIVIEKTELIGLFSKQ